MKKVFFENSFQKVLLEKGVDDYLLKVNFQYCSTLSFVYVLSGMVKYVAKN